MRISERSPATLIDSEGYLARLVAAPGGSLPSFGMLEGDVSKPWIVDVHSHLVPTGDDGVRTIDEGVGLCRRAAAHGTRVLYATPHVHAPWDSYPLTPERLARYERAFPLMQKLCATFGLELRRGFEIYPNALPPSVDIRDFALAESGGYLIEFPGSWTPEPEPLQAVWDEAERAELAGLVPVLAHPERCAEVVSHPDRLSPFTHRGWLLAVNALSLDGRHGRDSKQAAWRILDSGAGDLVASDAHSERRSPELDWTYELVSNRYGSERARALFDGSALEDRTAQAPAAAA